MTNTMANITLRDAMYAMSLAKRVPDAELLEDFVRRYPQYADALTDFAIELAIDALQYGEEVDEDLPPETEAISPAVARVMSQFQNRLFELQHAQPTAPQVRAATAVPAEPEPAPSSDEAYIESARCTTCNECTQINNKMFAYDENKQAHVADPDAGTYRQLVEAAESCQVSIIHPGKPRNPNEAGLDELIKRAEPFL